MKYFITTILCFGLMTAFAFRNPESSAPATKDAAVSYRMNCAQATRQTDLDINNVRARLLVGGDVWWDGNNGRYIVPNVEPGEVEVSSIFAGAVWLGGVDPAGNLKLAAQQFGTGGGASDFWPGPLTEDGFVDDQTCANWDNFFTVAGAEIDLHIALFQQSLISGNPPYDENSIPAGVKNWPGLGNPFFFEEFGFELPTAIQGLGAFHDENGDLLYNPLDGDYPIIEIRGCPEPQYPDEMKFWIYNDAGNIHTESMGDAIQMEIQVQAFAYSTNDELNNMTFSRYKLINRAVEAIDSTFFAMWVDADLGCSEDDYIGCDTTRSLMYIYNTDAVDGSSGSNCTGGVETYGSSIPYLGVDYFRGPLAPKVFGLDGTLVDPGLGEAPDTLIELGMTSFLYFNRASTTTAPEQTDPATAQEYYNYLTGTWRDGSLVTQGGSGIGGQRPTKFVFPDEPNDANGWSMCTANLPLEDRRTIQASGPFRLDPGQVNELIIGVPWVPNVTYPCPDMGRLQRADDIAQGLFNSCFDIIDGPDAPDVNWIELDQKLIAVMSNDEISSNNANYAYQELDPLAPEDLVEDSASYFFEGYLVYQLANLNVAIDELEDPDKARLVFQSDVANGASTIYNWEEIENPSQSPTDPPTIFVPVLEVEGEDEGVRTTFELTQDVFSGDPLVNHTTYYFTAIAYAFNQYEPFSAVANSGQSMPYLEGRRNIQTYSVTPRPIADRNVNAEYGDGAIITRLDGLGAGNNFLVLSNEERTRLFDSQEGLSGFTGSITYEPGGGPVTISVIDPLRVRDGDYVIRLDQSAALATGNSAWELFDAATNESLGRATQTLQNQNEELFPDLGISVTIQQTEDAGVDENTGEPFSPNNGAIGQTISYEDERLGWLLPVPDNAQGIDELAFFDMHFQPTDGGELNSNLDPDQNFTALGTGHFAPYTLMDWTSRVNFYATPAWLSTTSEIAQGLNPISSLNNVDIVFTNDKSKWSRCVVVETGNAYFTGVGFELDNGKNNFEVVERPSVGLEDNDGDGRPDPDGTGTGFAYFPGYAIDVETGTRLNIFFGENSAFGDSAETAGLGSLLEEVNGSDMMFNPSSQTLVPPNGAFNAFNLNLGGMHYMYVTKQPYDECAAINEALNENLSFRRIPAFQEISWAGIGLRSPDVELLSYAEGLIPTETVVSLRVDNPYDTSLGTNDNATFPSYQFKIEFIRQYNRDEVEIPNQGVNPGVPSSQINPVIEWDLRNSAAIPVSSGVYLIHIAAEGLGERVIKWFGVNREFDPSGL